MIRKSMMKEAIKTRMRTMTTTMEKMLPVAAQARLGGRTNREIPKMETIMMKSKAYSVLDMSTSLGNESKDSHIIYPKFGIFGILARDYKYGGESVFLPSTREI